MSYINRFTERSSNPKLNAQYNLNRRTPYVSDETLRFHYAKVLATGVIADGLGFWIIESTSRDMNNTSRGFRPVVFDVTGTVVYRPEMNDLLNTRKQAESLLVKMLKEINIKTECVKSLQRELGSIEKQIAELTPSPIA